MKPILIFLSLSLLIASCEDIIEIDLNSIDPRLVIEGMINDMDDQCLIKLSKTGDYFKPGIYPTVSDAMISVTDEHGVVTIFKEAEPGSYIAEDLFGVENTSYTLDVKSEGESYTANVKMPYKVSIDSLSFESTPVYMEFEGGYIVNCHFRDPVDFRNYYRMKTYPISDSSKANESIFVFNDDFVNGNRMITPWENDQFEPQDTVIVELQTLDKSSYSYYSTLNSILGGLFGSSNPANPASNLNNDALGYFGTSTISRDTIVISLI